MKILVNSATGAKELKDTDNGKTLGELIHKRKEVMKIDKKNMDDIPK